MRAFKQRITTLLGISITIFTIDCFRRLPTLQGRLFEIGKTSLQFNNAIRQHTVSLEMSKWSLTVSVVLLNVWSLASAPIEPRWKTKISRTGEIRWRCHHTTRRHETRLTKAKSYSTWSFSPYEHQFIKQTLEQKFFCCRAQPVEWFLIIAPYPWKQHIAFKRELGKVYVTQRIK